MPAAALGGLGGGEVEAGVFGGRYPATAAAGGAEGGGGGLTATAPGTVFTAATGREVVLRGGACHRTSHG